MGGEPRSQRRVLVVDDSEDTAVLMADLLDLWGHQAKTAMDGPAAIALAASWHPDVVLLDIGLPGMSGLAVAQELRRIARRPLTLIALTGYGQASDRAETASAGFDHHLLKPADLDRLRLLVEAAPVGEDCTFCRIVHAELAAHLVSEAEHSIAFLDRRPIFHGHTLIVPRVHHETLTELPEPLVAPLFLHARRVASAVVKVLGAEGSFVALNNKVSQSVPHLHVHVVPRKQKDGLRGFFWPRQKYDSEEAMAELAAKLRAELEA